MSTEYIVFLVIFIIILSLFAYLNTREGFVRALNSLLRLLIPMLLSGIIVKIAWLIYPEKLISYIIGGIGTVIFFLVLKNVIKNPEKKKINIFGYFMGFIVGIIEGWIVCGIIVLYFNFFHIVELKSMIAPALYNAIVMPVEWILFLSFIQFN